MMLVAHRFTSGTCLVFGLSLLAHLYCPPSMLAEEKSRFQFHGYWTQAYAEADGAPIFGIDEDGTFDYLSGALQVNFKISDNDRVVLQVATERLGDSPLDEVRDDIEIDWLFYEHRFSRGTVVHVGRVPLPYGIYNEIRDVGTVLEFYRPPAAIYYEGAFAAEAVDGVVILQPILSTSNWSIELDAYYGEWDRAEYFAPDVFDGTAENAHGLQLWLETPVSGLRIGAAAQRFDQTDGWEMIRPPGTKSRFDLTLFSIDADFGRVFARMEGQLIESNFGALGDTEIDGYYGMVGVRVTEAFQITAMYEDSKIEHGAQVVEPFYEDLALSLIYRFTPRFLARLEYHQYETVAADVARPPDQPFLEADVLILSASVAF